MHQEHVLDVLEETGALSRGHFCLTSGKHSNFYIQCARLMQYPASSALVCQALVKLLDLTTARKVDVVMGPATGAIILAYEVARLLGPQARAIFAERENNILTLRHGFLLAPGERVLVVEDVVTTGGSVKELLDIIAAKQAIAVGVLALVDRSGGTARFGRVNIPFKALVTMATEVYAPESCPLCTQGLPLVKPGSRQVV